MSQGNIVERLLVSMAVTKPVQARVSEVVDGLAWDVANDDEVFDVAHVKPKVIASEKLRDALVHALWAKSDFEKVFRKFADDRVFKSYLHGDSGAGLGIGEGGSVHIYLEQSSKKTEARVEFQLVSGELVEEDNPDTWANSQEFDVTKMLRKSFNPKSVNVSVDGFTDEWYGGTVFAYDVQMVFDINEAAVAKAAIAMIEKKNPGVIDKSVEAGVRSAQKANA